MYFTGLSALATVEGHIANSSGALKRGVMGELFVCGQNKRNTCAATSQSAEKQTGIDTLKDLRVYICTVKCVRDQVRTKCATAYRGYVETKCLAIQNNLVEFTVH